MPPPVGGSSWGCPAVGSIFHHRGYCSCESTVRPPHPCGWSCGAPLLGRRPPPGLCAGTPFISCFHGLQCSLAGLGKVALQYRSCHLPGRSAGSPQCVCPWGCRLLRTVPLLPSVHVRVRCPGPLGACSPVRALCAACVCCWWLRPSSPPPVIFLFSFLFFFFALYLFCFVLLFFF